MYGKDEVQDGKMSNKKCGLFAETELSNLYLTVAATYIGMRYHCFIYITQLWQTVFVPATTCIINCTCVIDNKTAATTACVFFVYTVDISIIRHMTRGPNSQPLRSDIITHDWQKATFSSALLLIRSHSLIFSLQKNI